MTQPNKEVKKRGYENCWEFWKCSPDLQAQCPVYKAKAGKECWIYTDNLKVFDWIRDKRKFNSCLECPWYQRKHPAKKLTKK